MASKIVFAFIAALVLGTSALATQASARPYGHWMGHGGYTGSIVSSAGFGGGR